MIHRFSGKLDGHDASSEVTVEPIADGRFRVTVDGRERVIDARRIGAATWSLLTEGDPTARLVAIDGSAPDLRVAIDGAALPVKLLDARSAIAGRLAGAHHHSGPQPVRAPIPGKIVKILVRQGEAVRSGQGVVVVEAMKMENELRAPRDGTVVELAAREGVAVEAGQVLATIG